MGETQTMYILLTDTGTLFTRVIKQYTGAPYNHASIAFDESLHELYSFGRKHPLNPIYGGFVREDVIKRYARYFPHTTCAIYALEVDSRTAQKIKRVIDVFQTKPKRYTYNYIGLFGIVFNYPIKIAASYFCSQFVAEVLRRAGVVLWEKPSALVTPEDFRRTEKMTLVYEGKLTDYSKIQLPMDKIDAYSFKKGFFRGLQERMLLIRPRKIHQLVLVFAEKIRFEDVLGRDNKKKK